MASQVRRYGRFIDEGMKGLKAENKRLKTEIRQEPLEGYLQYPLEG